MKKLLLSIALFSFVGLTTISASPCDDDKKCDKKECTSKKSKKECSKANAKKSCHSAKAKTTETKTAE
tara:strand:- start:412 stop:615 length:204 start_codon:yes stop_codon:yes gene_type:complete